MKQKRPSRAFGARSRSQRGVMLIEALVAIAIFSFAILGIVGLQATAIRTVSEADYRAKASFFATQIVGQMWVDRFNVPTYALNAGGNPCATGANSASNTAVTNWLSGLTDLTKQGALPGAANLKQQITVGANNTVIVTICWKSPQEADNKPPHNFTLTTQIQG